MSEHPLAHVRAKTPRQQAVLDALIEAGWVYVTAPFPGAVIFGHPDNDVEMPTPDYVTTDMWPGETYTARHTVTMLIDGTGRTVPASAGHSRECQEVKVQSVLKREHSAPWVTGRDQNVSLTKAIHWIRAPHPATRHRKDPADG
jgi:hypothetical protein